MTRRPERRTGDAPAGIAKRSLTIAGHRTSISLEAPFWTALADIAGERGTSVAAIVAAVDRRRLPETNLSAAVRIHVLDWYRRKLAALATGAAGSSADRTRPDRG